MTSFSSIERSYYDSFNLFADQLSLPSLSRSGCLVSSHPLTKKKVKKLNFSSEVDLSVADRGHVGVLSSHKAQK